MTEKSETGEIRRLEQASDSELKQAWQTCARLTRRHAGNFYYAFIFMPVERRRAIQALYAFCRAGDDAVDEETRDPAASLARLRERLDLCYDDCYIDDLTLALAHAIRNFELERRHFEELLLGVEMDLNVKRYQSFDELRLYCYRVASTVGLLCLRIFGCDTEDSRKYAETLGIGMQLTNILRDIREDLERGRIYIPLEDLRRFDIDEQALFLPGSNHHLQELVKCMAARAEAFLDEADGCLKNEMKRCLYPAMIMAAIYREILHKICTFNDLGLRVELTRTNKIKIAQQILDGILR